MDYVSQLKRIRQGQKVSIKKLSEMSGVHKHTINDWEYQGAKPTIENFNKVLNSLGYELQIVERGNSPKGEKRC